MIKLLCMAKAEFSNTSWISFERNANLQAMQVLYNCDYKLYAVRQFNSIGIIVAFDCGDQLPLWRCISMIHGSLQCACAVIS